jgi:hypothetical protein
MARKRKRSAGRPTKIDEQKKAEIMACLSVGASLQDAADFIGVDVSNLRRLKQRDPNFALGLRQSRARGKLVLMNKIHKSTQWSAAAWMLGKLYPKKFARERLELTGKDGGPIKTEARVKPDLSQLSVEQLRALHDIQQQLLGIPPAAGGGSPALPAPAAPVIVGGPADQPDPG